MTAIERLRANLIESRYAVDLLRDNGKVPYATLEQERHDADALRAAELAERDAEIARLTKANVRASAELRHAYRDRERVIDHGLVARAIKILETAALKGETP